MSYLQQNVQALLDAHPKDCIWVMDACDTIVSRIRMAVADGQKPSHAFVEAASGAEIFCPHEGIDRLPKN